MNQSDQSDHENTTNKTESNIIPEDEILLQPFNYIQQRPGKQIRKQLVQAFNYWLNISSEKCDEISEIVQMLHNASIIVDDIEDNSILRRGVPAAHKVYGIGNALNSANYAYYLSLDKAINLGHPKAVTVFSRQMIELHRGQGMDIYWRDNFICPSEEKYKDMIRQKTGGLFDLSIQLMQLFSENKSDFSKICEYIGLYFQIRDDYANLKSQEYNESKSYCEDLSEGKFSFPIIHAINTHPEDQRILDIVKQRTTNVNIKKQAVDLMEEFGSFEYTRKELSSLEKKILKQIHVLGENVHLFEIIKKLKNI